MPDSQIEKFIKSLSNEDIWLLYASSILELKERGLIRTRNIVGERGEFLAIEIYKSISGVPNLQAAPEGTQNVDALSRNGERYSIKTITKPSKTTGVFHGCGNIDDNIEPDKKFEYVIIMIIDEKFQLVSIIELSWKQFLKYRKWHTTMRAWNLSLTKDLVKEAKIIFNKDKK